MRAHLRAHRRTPGAGRGTVHPTTGRGVLPLGVGLLALLAWELAGRLALVTPVFLPARPATRREGIAFIVVYAAYLGALLLLRT